MRLLRLLLKHPEVCPVSCRQWHTRADRCCHRLLLKRQVRVRQVLPYIPFHKYFLQIHSLHQAFQQGGHHLQSVPKCQSVQNPIKVPLCGMFQAVTATAGYTGDLTGVPIQERNVKSVSYYNAYKVFGKCFINCFL